MESRDRIIGDKSLVILAVLGLIALGMAQSHVQGAGRFLFYAAAVLGMWPLGRAAVLRLRSYFRTGAT